MNRLTRLFFLLSLSLSFLMTGCTSVQFVAPYDETMDKGLTELQQKSDKFIDSLIANKGTSKASYANNKAYYNETAATLRALRFRADSLPKNKLGSSLVNDVSLQVLGGKDPKLAAAAGADGSVDDEVPGLMGLHQIQSASNPFNEANNSSLEAARGAINQTFRAALALELAKKRN